jgi:peptide/nickel transport system substrate-binding protein
MRRRWLACGIAASALLASACTAATDAGAGAQPDGSAQPQPGYLAVADGPDGGTLDLQLHIDTAAAAGLDPQAADLAISWQLMSLVYETLVTVGPSFEIEPLLAESWETPSPTEYVFHLREDVAFSNGRPMTATDVVGSMERLLAGQTVWAAQIGPVESVEAPDDHTVRFTLAAPYTPFLAALANVPAAVLPMTEVEEGSVDLETEMLGTGPFVVARHRQDVAWTFERNPDYWAPGKPALDTVNVQIVPQEAARIAALQDGSAGMAVLGNVDSPSVLEGAGGVGVLTQATTDFYYLMLNTQAPDSKFADERVREASNIAIDREQVAEIALDGLGQPTGVTPAGLPGACDPSALPSATAGAERARELLAEAGAEDLTMTLSIFSTEPAPAVAQVIQQNLQEIGVTVDIEQLDEATWSGKVYGEVPATFDAALSWFAGYADASMVTRWWNPETAAFNVGFMGQNDELAGLVDAAAQAPAGAGRDRALQDVCEGVDADAQMLPLVTRPQIVGYRTDAVSPSLYAEEGYGNALRLLAETRAAAAG